MATCSSMQSKLKELRLYLKFEKQTDFAKELGVSQATIANIENGKREISKPIWLKIKTKFGIDLFCWEPLKTRANHLDKVHDTCTSNVVSIPFYSAKAAAGAGAELPNYPEKDVIYFDKRLLQNVLGINQENAAFITAEGDSMLPLINDGDLLLVDSSVQDIINGKVFVIKDGNDLRVKRLKQEWNGDIYLISDNEKYPPEKVNHPINIIGRVVWNGTKEIL